MTLIYIIKPIAVKKTKLPCLLSDPRFVPP